MLKPVVLNLPECGIRLRFDGPDQRLRLVEVLDFTRLPLTYKNLELVKGFRKSSGGEEQQASAQTGPSFRQVYNRLFGPTYPGEYSPPDSKSETHGLYVLSYPGIAFSFPLEDSAWSQQSDFVSLLSSSATSAAKSLAIFHGASWPEARSSLFTKVPQNPRSVALSGRNKDSAPDEIEQARIHGAGRVELVRRSSSPFWITLSETTPQDLVAELGPPDAVYRKNDRRISIHGANASASNPMLRRTSQSPGQRDAVDTDHSSSHSYTDESDTELPQDAGVADGSSVSSECFYNYFHHGFDAFISHPTKPSPPFPGSSSGEQEPASILPSSRLVVTKILLHANVPGSYSFNRHRRSRWIIHTDPSSPEHDSVLTSEMPFSDISNHLKDVWRGSYASAEEEASLQRGMVLNRGWGDSPESSVELLGGFEDHESHTQRNPNMGGSSGVQGLGNTELFGFPGLLFEVLKNGTVSCLTVY